MIIKSADFIKSSPQVKDCPPGDKPEYAFLGRSNVGKSSLINMITGRKALAKTSSTPGKTRLINHFVINNEWYLADLPGFGYAKVSKTSRRQWEKMIRNYLLQRRNLLCSFILIDSRIPAQQKDLELLAWFGMHNLPFVLIYTKTDKLGVNALQKQVDAINREIMEEWESLPQLFIPSAQTGKGKDEVLSFIEETNTLFS